MHDYMHASIVLNIWFFSPGHMPLAVLSAQYMFIYMSTCLLCCGRHHRMDYIASYSGDVHACMTASWTLWLIVYAIFERGACLPLIYPSRKYFRNVKASFCMIVQCLFLFIQFKNFHHLFPNYGSSLSHTAKPFLSLQIFPLQPVWSERKY